MAQEGTEFLDLKLRIFREECFKREPKKWILCLPQSARAQRVLDIGCGLGYDSMAWARAGKRAVAVDFVFDLVRNAAELARLQDLPIAFVVAEAERLPFRDDAFDIGFTESLLEHVPRWENVIREGHRVLKPEGVFFASTTNRHCPINREINHFHFYPWLPKVLKKPIMAWIQKHRPAWINYTNHPAVHWFTHPGLARYFQRVGFEPFEVLDVVTADTISPGRRALFFVVQWIRAWKLLRYLLYLLLPTVELLGVKKAVAPANAR